MTSQDEETTKVIHTSYIAKIRSFSGDEEDEDPQQWIEDLEKAINANGWNQKRALSIIPFYLKGTANEWYNEFENAPETVEDFTTQFMEEFCNDDNIKYKLKWKIETTKQKPTETVSKYYGRFKNLIRRINRIGEYYTKEQVMDKFIHGLLPEIVKEVILKHPKSTDEALKLAKEYEAVNEMVKHTKAVNVALGEETSSKTTNEEIEKLESRITQKLDNFFTRQTEVYQPPQKRNNNNNNNNNNNTPQENQWQTETRTCHYCKRVGHILRDCRTKRNDENRWNQSNSHSK